VATWLLPTEDGRVATSRGSGDFTMHFMHQGLRVERDAGVLETIRRTATEPQLPADLPRRYANADTAAILTITATEAAAELHVSGP